MSAQVYVTGAKVLSKELGDFVRDMKKLRLAQSLEASGRLVQRSARRNVGALKLKSRTGRLRSSITATMYERKNRLSIDIGPEGMPQKLYGWIHERGSTDWPKREFLGPATQENQEKIFRLIEKASRFGTRKSSIR